jgi:hypothetical protein
MWKKKKRKRKCTFIANPGEMPCFLVFLFSCGAVRKSSKRVRIQRLYVPKIFFYFIQLVNTISAEVKVSGLGGEGKCVHCGIARRYAGVYGGRVYQRSRCVKVPCEITNRVM